MDRGSRVEENFRKTGKFQEFVENELKVVDFIELRFACKTSKRK